MAADADRPINAAATDRTPSAVSQQSRTAQREFGVRLVEPRGRGIRLTEAGPCWLADAGRDVARVLAQARARFDEFRGEPAGVATTLPAPPWISARSGRRSRPGDSVKDH